MSKQRRHSRDFLWPVPPSELEDIEVLEHRDETSGPPLWRRRNRSREAFGSDEDDQPGASEAPSEGVSLAGLPWRGQGPAHDGRNLTPAAGPRGWLGAAERVGLLVAGVLIGMVITRLDLPDATRDGGPMTTQGSPLAGAATLVSGPSTQPVPTILGVRLLPPSTTAVPAATRARPLVADPPAIGTPVRRARTPAADTAPGETPAPLRPVRDYAVALSRLDARATQAVYPSVDRGQLVQRFTALREQRLILGTCATAVTGTQALVTCPGTLRYRPRVGDHATRVKQGRWRFGLSSVSGTWVITSVEPS